MITFSVLDYVDLITNSGIYDRAIGLDTPEQTIQAIKDSGYATDSSYVSKVMEIINKYDLTQFDKY
ncbi:glucosaminidase domain-containing protein [Sutterella wadsworthensis]|uniref:glucosaminidase domain-containing protein n=1 Tax=Sutterella wadsworthensis TaxID=40545 RepID=UPI003D711B88